MSKADIQDIREYVLFNIEQYIQDFVKFESNLLFSDYVQSKIATQLAHKYDRYKIQEAFEHPKLIAVLDFYSKDEDEDSQIIVH